MASQHSDLAPQQATVAPALSACPECDLLQKLPPLAPGARLRCARCRCVLASRPPGHSDLPLALTCTAAVVYLVANLLPLMGLSVVGRSASTTIVGGAYEMWMQGQMVTAVLVAFCAVIAPGCYIGFVLVLLLGRAASPSRNGSARYCAGFITCRSGRCSRSCCSGSWSPWSRLRSLPRSPPISACIRSGHWWY